MAAGARRQLLDYCERKVPQSVRHQVRLEVELEGQAATIIERRVPAPFLHTDKWSTLPVARFRYTRRDQLWRLYWRDRNLRWRLYDLVPPSHDLGPLIAELEADPTCIFWG
jgi:hypothetical protein